jgi:oxalate decarboxylase
VLAGQLPFVPPRRRAASFRSCLGAVARKSWDGGWAKEATVAEFPVSEELAGVLMSLVLGRLRELHWHPNADEWQYYISGRPA